MRPTVSLPRVSALVPLLAAAMLGGCSTFNDASLKVTELIQPYRIEVVQGNFVSREQVAALKPGMSRLQVREILGTPLLTSVFHGNRWDYVFSLKRQGSEPQQRRLSIFFKDDALERFEGDEMPTEAEFVASLDGSRKAATVPRLEATEEEIARARPVPAPAGAQPSVAAPAPAPAAVTAPTAFPPLEPGAR